MEKNNIIVSLKGVNKAFGDEKVVKNLNLEIREGEFLTLLGPSGCGKTTTLRMIGGFEVPDEGEIKLEGQNVEDKKPNERNVNTVFQNYALFPHMTIADNIAFGLVEKKVPKEEIKERVAEMLKLVRLEGMEKRKPSQLSGGQKQRVAIARALINRPKVLLLDEPLGALDLKLRKEMQMELKNLQKQLHITFLYVTHDQEEALLMSDRIAVMHDGRMEQLGSPEEIYNQPKTKFVANFIGQSNLMEGYVTEVGEKQNTFTFEFGNAHLESPRFQLEEMFYICVRPENLRLSLRPVDHFHIRARVTEVIFAGSVNRTMVRLINGQTLRAESQPDVDVFEAGSDVYVWWRQDKSIFLHTKEEDIYNVIEGEMDDLMEEKSNFGIDDIL